MRNRSQPIVNSFSEELYGSGEYFSDYDLIVTDNSTYHQYIFVDGEYTTKPRIKRIIEVKYDSTDYVKKLLKNEIQPNAQVLAFASLVEEVNAHRHDKVEMLYVVQTKGEYPYHLFVHEDRFRFVRTVHSREEFIDVLQLRSIT